MSFILAITGPAGSGKTTVGAKLASEVDRCHAAA
jgi:cytidylate kinase